MEAVGELQSATREPVASIRDARDQARERKARSTDSRRLSEPRIKAIAVTSAIIGAAYLIWRGGWTLNEDALWLAVPLLVAEVHGYFTFLGLMFMTWQCQPPRRPRPFRGASVDFFIPTYNEPFSVLAPTIAGAVAVRYPHRTYVLDDGRRDWVKRLCRRMGAHYIARPSNEHAKAGNLNYALSQTKSEYVAVVDADFVPGPHFIHALLGYFRDPKLAFVQAPQEFYNRDSFQHLRSDKDSWHEQTMFFRAIQLGKNHWNAAFWCGCPSLIRRAALDSIGGVATETVTEDLHTSIRLHAKGWNSIYHSGTVALGIAPGDYDGYILQRLRWAEGTMQVIRREWRMRGLSLPQVINYFASTSTYFDALRKAAFLAIIPLVLITDTLPIDANAMVFVPFWGLQFALGLVANKALGRGYQRYWMTEFFDMMKMFAFIRATTTLIRGRRIRFQVTPKGQAGEHRLHNLLKPYVAVWVIYLVSVVIGMLRLGDFWLSTENETSTLAAILWGWLILAFLLVVVIYGVQHISRRGAERVHLVRQGTYRSSGSRVAYPLELQDLTTAGCSFVTKTPPAFGEEIRIHIQPVGGGLKGSVRRLTRTPDGSTLVGIQLDVSESNQARLAAVIASGLFPAIKPRGANPELRSAVPQRLVA